MRVLAVVAFAALASCGGSKGPDDVERVARALFESVRAGNEQAFVDLHVRAGDMSPDGSFWICTRAGGVKPDAAWTQEVRGLFQRNRERFAELAKNGAASFVSFTSASRSETYVNDILFRVAFGAKTVTGRIGAAMVAQRGVVIVGHPGGIEFFDGP